jgi:N-methylhydantoinase A
MANAVRIVTVEEGVDPRDHALIAMGGAGADPGPACYGRGGTRPTVTDADVVCGYLNPDYFLGGAQTLDVAASRAALKTHVADPLKMDVLAAAAGIQRIVDMRMADEVRVFAAKRGVDLSTFTLLPFGGAGAVHAAAVAEELGVRRILVPPRPGAFSALGLLCTDVVHDYIRSELRPLNAVTPEHAEDVFGQLEDKARAELVAEGMDAAAARFVRELDLRYTGQGYELRTPLDGLFDEHLTAASLSGARDRFDERHAQIHGHATKERPVEVVSYRVRVRVTVPKFKPRAEPEPASARSPYFAEMGRRRIHLGVKFTSDNNSSDTSSSNKTSVEARLYERDRLGIGASIDGPAIVEQFDSTTVIPPGWTGRVDGYRNLILERR